MKKIRNGVSQMHPFGDESINFGGWLGELSYSSRVDLGCDGILLVEGTTDILCFQELLRKIGKDQKYVLISLGGGSLINGGSSKHLAELFRIVHPSRIHAFIDSEKTSSEDPIAKDRLTFKSECESIGIHVHISDRRATENYFEERGIDKALGDGYQPLGEFQKLKDAVRPWSKSESWRIARETSFDDIRQTDLGRFLQEL